MLAEDLLGYPADAINRANLFLSQPDQQLNRWTDGNTISYYGQGYLLNRYIYDRVGTDIYREFAQHPLPGLQAVSAVAADNDLSFDGLSLWEDWLVANGIHDLAGVPERYQLPLGLVPAASQTIDRYPFNVDTTVNQYAADYYEISGSGPVSISFSGSNHTQLVGILPASGQTMWVANRANFSQAQLTRAFDLQSLSTATLRYKVYRDIERGYDFGYASISLDGGTTWQSLNANQMDGLDFADNPGDGAFTERFYTGRGNSWVEEVVDLTPYTGQIVQIRFEYVTDPILTFHGMAIDDIAIPEIGYADDVESDDGWTANGFVRATGYIPQTWHVQLVRFVNGAPQVERLPVDAAGQLSFDLPLEDQGNRPLLIIGASAPMTLNPANYQLIVNE